MIRTFLFKIRSDNLLFNLWLLDFSGSVVSLKTYFWFNLVELVLIWQKEHSKIDKKKINVMYRLIKLDNYISKKWPPLYFVFVVLLYFFNFIFGPFYNTKVSFIFIFIIYKILILISRLSILSEINDRDYSISIFHKQVLFCYVVRILPFFSSLKFNS